MRHLPLFALLGKYRFSMGIACLRSFVQCCRDDYQLIILEDGTMGPEREAAVREALPSARLVPRKELEERAAPFLKNHPRSAAFLNEHILSLKLLVPPAMAQELGGDFAYVDTDVFFFRPFIGLDRRPMTSEQLVYMSEERDSYSLAFKARHFGPDRVRLPAGFNSGVLFVRNGAFDLDFVEQFLSRDAYRLFLGLTEQTAWAALAAKTPSRRFDPAQINIPNRTEDITPQLVGQHFVGNGKALAEHEEYLKLVSSVVAANDVASLRTLPAQFPTLVSSVWKKTFQRLGGNRQLALANSTDPSALLLPGLRRLCACQKEA